MPNNPFLRGPGGLRTGRTFRSTAVLGTLAALLLVVLPTPAGAAANPPIGPPFAHTVSAATETQYGSGCGSANITAPVAWNATTGAISGGFAATAVPCTPTLAGVGASSAFEAQGVLLLGFPIAPHTSGGVALTAALTLRATVGAGMLPGRCVPDYANVSSSCVVHGEALATVAAYLEDLATGSDQWASNGDYIEDNAYNFTYCATTCVSTVGGTSVGTLGHIVLYLNATTVSTDRYVLVVQFVFAVFAYAEASKATLHSAAAMADFSLGGRGVPRSTLNAISVR